MCVCLSRRPVVFCLQNLLKETFQTKTKFVLRSSNNEIGKFRKFISHHQQIRKAFLISLQYCLSGDPAKPCYVISFKELLIMLDCGLTAQTILNFLPLPLVHSQKFQSLPIGFLHETMIRKSTVN